MSPRSDRLPAGRVIKGLSPLAEPRRLPYPGAAMTAAPDSALSGAVPVSGGSPLHGTAAQASAAAPMVGAVAPASAMAGAAAYAPEDEARIEEALMQAETAGYQQGLAKAQRDADGVLAKARDALEAEFRQREAQRQAEVAEALARLEGALQGVTAEQQSLRQQVSGLAVSLAFEALCRLLARSQDRRQILLDLVTEALDRSGLAGQGALPVLRLSRADAQLLAAAGEEAQAVLSRVQVVEANGLLPMEALLERSGAGLDIGLRTQLELLRAAWSDTLARHAATHGASTDAAQEGR